MCECQHNQTDLPRSRRSVHGIGRGARDRGAREARWDVGGGDGGWFWSAAVAAVGIGMTVIGYATVVYL